MVYIYTQQKINQVRISELSQKHLYHLSHWSKKKSIQLLFLFRFWHLCSTTLEMCTCMCIHASAHAYPNRHNTHRHTWTNRNYTHGHTQTHHHRHNALTPVQVKSSAEEWLHSAEQCYKPGLCSSAIAACGHLFLWSPFCFQTAGWMMLCSHSTGCWQEDKMHAIMFQVTWDRVGKTNVIILMMKILKKKFKSDKNNLKRYQKR